MISPDEQAGGAEPSDPDPSSLIPASVQRLAVLVGVKPEQLEADVVVSFIEKLQAGNSATQPAAAQDTKARIFIQSLAQNGHYASQAWLSANPPPK
jgi:hypothetical protein